jgi:uncharacterized protein (TIGR02246 family)
MRTGALLFVGVIAVSQAQQLPHSQVFFQNAEGESSSFGLSCDDRQNWKAVTLKGHEGQRFECDSSTAKMWGHVNTDLAGESHQEVELSIQNGKRYEVYFDQSIRKWNLRLMGDSGTTSASTDATVAHGGDEAAIRSTFAAWVAAIRARNLPGILDLITDDCIILVPGEPPVTGKDGVRKMYQQRFARYGGARIEPQAEIQEIQIFGDAAFWRGTDDIIVTPQDGAPTKFAGYGMGLLRRGNDGRWRFVRWMAIRSGGS